MNPHRPRRPRTRTGALLYLDEWRQRVEFAERRVRLSSGNRVYFGSRASISTELTGCPACDGHLFGDMPRDRLERLMRRDGRRAHRLRVAVTRLDERYRDATVEVSAPQSLPWWERRVPWA